VLNRSLFRLLAALTLTSLPLATQAQPAAPTAVAQMDRDLLEVTIPQLQRYYAERKYTVTQVVDWYLARIARYNGIYRPLEQVFAAEARALAVREDSEMANAASHGSLWGIPIVIKANTSVAGKVTTDGWEGYVVPGHELVAPRDATVVARLRAAGAIILGHTNMPDFANADTNRSSSFGRTGNAFDVRFSPGGSSGGTVTAVTANLAVLGNGTDTGNSIRMPSATSALIGVFPTRGLVSIAGIAPLDWLLDNTGPIARTVTDAAIALEVMAGEDPLDPVTRGSAAKAQHGYLQYLKSEALKGKRFAVPAFVLQGIGVPFHGTPAAVSELAAAKQSAEQSVPLDPRTREAFLKAIEQLRALGATVIMDDSVLPASFARMAARISTYAYVREGTDLFLKDFGPPEYHSSTDYERVLGAPLGAPIVGTEPSNAQIGEVKIAQRLVENDKDAERNFHGPKRRTLDVYLETMDRLHLDGYVYPAIQMPPVDETMPQDGRVSEGPHSATSWVNMLGVPAVVVVGGFYESGLPFGLELSGRPFRDGDLLGYAYAWEQATHHRHPPVLVDKGLLPDAR
jgi:Asp-tRNA(Asn)/Glu-tRNA(Gln) amidotransferase A subunit family amidase